MVLAQKDISLDRIAAFCKKWGVKEFALFGSILREDFGLASDIDVLYVMCPGRKCGLIEYFDMKEELEAVFGRPVDLVDRKCVEESPNWVRRRAILSTAETVYAE